jgi:putative transposase
MGLIDRIYTKYPFYGSRRVRVVLSRDYETSISRERVQRLMRLMGIQAVYPKKKTTIASSEHLKYPYLLRNTVALYPNHIWGTDITYVKLETGWCYLVAILDWFSRKIINWGLSSNLEGTFCVDNLKAALGTATPTIHNSDQGSQFTGEAYVGVLGKHDPKIKISMDGRGRCMDNIFTERLWRTVKYENIYLSSYANIEEALAGLATYIRFYNEKRPHQALGYATPEEIYRNQSKINPETKGRNQKLAAISS